MNIKHSFALRITDKKRCEGSCNSGGYNQNDACKIVHKPHDDKLDRQQTQHEHCGMTCIQAGIDVWRRRGCCGIIVMKHG